MTDRKRIKRRKFAHEILGLIGISALVALIVFLLLVNIAVTAAEVYCFERDVPMTEFDWIDMDRWIFGSGAILALCVFCVLFLSLLRERLAYIRKITDGINAMRAGETDTAITLEGNNELTELADAINYMSAARQQVLEKERALAQEKEQLIRSLSHDIRTPLTSILAYSEYLAGDAEVSRTEQKAYLTMIRRKAQQIRELTDILLDGSKRSPERFENARLLMEQLAAEFAESLEESFTVRLVLDRCGAFAGSFDVQELRRIFDNLASNVQKYANPARPVELSFSVDASGLIIRQANAVRTTTEPQDSYHLGIPNIRRIAQHYGGSAEIRQDSETFEITIILSNF